MLEPLLEFSHKIPQQLHEAIFFLIPKNKVIKGVCTALAFQLVVKQNFHETITLQNSPSLLDKLIFLY